MFSTKRHQWRESVFLSVSESNSLHVEQRGGEEARKQTRMKQQVTIPPQSTAPPDPPRRSDSLDSVWRSPPQNAHHSSSSDSPANSPHCSCCSQSTGPNSQRTHVGSSGFGNLHVTQHQLTDPEATSPPAAHPHPTRESSRSGWTAGSSHRCLPCSWRTPCTLR